MFNALRNIFSSKEAGEARTHVVTPQRQVVPIRNATGGTYRNGMWVRAFGHTGILDDIRHALLTNSELAQANEAGLALVVPSHTVDEAANEVSLAKVVLTDADGMNQTTQFGDRLVPLVLYVPLDRMRQAYAAELPAKRTGHLSAEQLHTGGYHASEADRRLAIAAGWRGQA